MPRHRPAAVADITGGFAVQAEVTITPGDRVTPPVIALPPTVALTLRVHNHDARPHTIAVHGHHIRVPAAAARFMHVDLSHGTFLLAVDDRSEAKLTVGALGGP
jgi:hypothetical protein